jgi:hypothetical protein
MLKLAFLAAISSAVGITRSLRLTTFDDEVTKDCTPWSKAEELTLVNRGAALKVDVDIVVGGDMRSTAGSCTACMETTTGRARTPKFVGANPDTTQDDDTIQATRNNELNMLFIVIA